MIRCRIFAFAPCLALGAALLTAAPASGQAQHPDPMKQPQSEKSPSPEVKPNLTPAQSVDHPSQPSSQSSAAGPSDQNAQTQQLAAQGEKLVGRDVYGADNERMGEVKNVVMGPDSRVNAVLVDIGGFLGIGAKTVSIPLEQLTAEGDRVVASSLTKEQAREIPEYKEPEQQNRQRQGG